MRFPHCLKLPAEFFVLLFKSRQLRENVLDRNIKRNKKDSHELLLYEKFVTYFTNEKLRIFTLLKSHKWNAASVFLKKQFYK